MPYEREIWLRHVKYACGRVCGIYFISHCDNGAIFHNSRSKLFHIRRKSNISPKNISCNFVLRAHIGATILHPNTKVLDFQGLFVLLWVENTPPSPLYLFPDLMDLNLRLYKKHIERITFL